MTAREEMLVKMGWAAMREHSIVCAHHMPDAEAARIGLAAFAAIVGPDCERCMLKPERCGMSLECGTVFYPGDDCPVSEGE